MAVIEDIYRLTTQSNTSELQAAQQVLGAQIGQLKARLADFGVRAGAAARELTRLRPTASGAALAFRNMAGAAGVAVRGMGSLFNAAARGVGVLAGFGRMAFNAVRSLVRIGGAAFNALGGMDALTEVMDGVSAGGSGVAKETEAASEGMNAMGEAAASTQVKVKGLMGAFGDVGAGFVQRQGQAAETVTRQGDTVAQSLKEVDKAFDNTGAKMGSFGQEVSRLGKAWENIRNIILRAIGTAILPLINALATALEDPRFIGFVTLLAEDLAGAISAVVDWLINQAIPAVLAFFDEINAAGGPVAWFQQKWEELKTTVMQVVAIILGTLLIAANNAQAIFTGIGDVAAALWERVSTTFMQLVAILLAGLLQASQFFNSTWTAIGAFVATKWNEMLFKIALAFISIKAKVTEFKTFFQTAWQGMSDFVGGIFQGIVDFVTAQVAAIATAVSGLGEILIIPWQVFYDFVAGPEGILGKVRGAFGIGINAIIMGLNALIEGYNDIGGKFGLPGINTIAPVSMAAGGIATRPTLAMVGDARTPEVVAPLGDLLPMIGDTVRGALGATGGSLTIERIEVNVGNTGNQTPYQTGVDIARGLKSEITRMRQVGLRIPAGAF